METMNDEDTELCVYDRKENYSRAVTATTANWLMTNEIINLYISNNYPKERTDLDIVGREIAENPFPCYVFKFFSAPSNSISRRVKKKE